MKSITAILPVLAAVLSSATADHIHPKLLCTNSTLNISHPINATACSNITASTSTSLLPTIYTSPPNSSIPPPTFYLYSFYASVDQYDGRAQYSFKWIINPDFSAVQCRASVPTPNGTLADVKVAHCQQDKSWQVLSHLAKINATMTDSWQTFPLPSSGASSHTPLTTPLIDPSYRRKIHNYTVPAHFTFGWTNLNANSSSSSSSSGGGAYPTGPVSNGTALLVLRSTNPASAHHCPDFPHDACWAQGLYWVPRQDVMREGSGSGDQAYIGADDLVVMGMYCRSGMPECAWSEYLY